MKVSVLDEKKGGDALALLFIENKLEVPRSVNSFEKREQNIIKTFIKKTFRGKKGEAEAIPLGKRWKWVVLLGLGKEEKLDGECFRFAGGALMNRIGKYKLNDVAIELPHRGTTILSLADMARCLVEGVYFSSYRYEEFKKRENEFSPISELVIITKNKDVVSQVERAQLVGEEHSYVRDLVNRPACALGPEEFASEASSSASKLGLRFKVFRQNELKRMGYNGILAVGRGSKREPLLLELENDAPKKGRPIVLVGKGVTFDSGGLSLKTAEGMQRMKYDMAGAAAVLGTIRTAKRMNLNVRVIALIPLVENMPDAFAQRPGDIVRMANGMTVEVISTDAEGRLILGDALYHGTKFKPTAMIDVATLTGACNIALGRFAIGLMGNDENLLSKLSHAGISSGERTWILPLWEEYQELVKSDIADLRNVGHTREAGTIVGGIFIEKFVNKTPWAHLDIASTAFSEHSHPYLGKGATGQGMRLLVRYLEEISK